MQPRRQPTPRPGPPAARRRSAGGPAALAGHRDDADAARRLLADPEPAVRATALGALQRLGELRADELAAALADAVAGGAGPGAPRWRPPGRATPPPSLVALLADADPAVVEVAAWAVGERRPARAGRRSTSLVAHGHRPRRRPVPRGGGGRAGRHRRPGRAGRHPRRHRATRPPCGAAPSSPWPPSTAPRSTPPWRRPAPTATGRSARPPRIYSTRSLVGEPPADRFAIRASVRLRPLRHARRSASLPRTGRQPAIRASPMQASGKAAGRFSRKAATPSLGVGGLAGRGHDLDGVGVGLGQVHADLGVEGLLAQRLRRRRCPGWPGASRSSTAASSSSSGTTRLISPQSAAVAASMASPVRAISRARLRPMVRPMATMGVVQNHPALPPGRGEARPTRRPRPGRTTPPAGTRRRWPGRAPWPPPPAGSTGGSASRRCRRCSRRAHRLRSAPSMSAKSWPDENTGPLAASTTPRASDAPISSKACWQLGQVVPRQRVAPIGAVHGDVSRSGPSGRPARGASIPAGRASPLALLVATMPGAGLRP